MFQVEDLDVSDAVNEASIGQELDQILTDVGGIAKKKTQFSRRDTRFTLSVGDNSVGTRKRAIEAIMEFKKKKHGEHYLSMYNIDQSNFQEIRRRRNVSQLRALRRRFPRYSICLFK